MTEPYPPQSYNPSGYPGSSAGFSGSPSGYSAPGQAGGYLAPTGPAGPTEPPKSNVGWAVAAVIFFWPLAFSAFTHALDVYPAWARGDIARATYASERARTLGRWALGIWAALMLAFIIFYVAVIAVVVTSAPSATW